MHEVLIHVKININLCCCCCWWWW